MTSGTGTSLSATQSPSLSDVFRIEVRMIEPRDVPACMGIAALSWDRLIGGMAQADLNEAFGASPWRPVFYVAEVDGRVVGFAAYGCSWLGYCIYSLTWVNVRPDFQGRGIGTKLIRRCLDDLRPLARVVILITEKATALYEKFGFKALAKYASENGGGEETMMGLEFAEATRLAAQTAAPAEIPHSWTGIKGGWECRHCHRTFEMKSMSDKPPQYGCDAPTPAVSPAVRTLFKHHGECATCGEEIGEDHVRNVDYKTGVEWHVGCSRPVPDLAGTSRPNEPETNPSVAYIAENRDALIDAATKHSSAAMAASPSPLATPEGAGELRALLPCPFCGGTPKLAEVCHGDWCVECQTCRVSTPLDSDTSRSRAAWNTRSPLRSETPAAENSVVINEAEGYVEQFGKRWPLNPMWPLLRDKIPHASWNTPEEAIVDDAPTTVWKSAPLPDGSYIGGKRVEAKEGEVIEAAKAINAAIQTGMWQTPDHVSVKASPLALNLYWALTRLSTGKETK